MEVCCALCEKRAMMQCDSDQAKLCWDCDEKVHSANFLVAKHLRVLLCRLCHSLTPWKASGTKLTPTVSFCHRCVADRHNRFHQLERDERSHPNYVEEDGQYGPAHDDDDADDGVDSDAEEEEDDDEDEEGENQVVPMSSASSSPPSGSELALKRLRNNSFCVDSHEETGCSSSDMLSGVLPSGDESTSIRVFGSFKKHRNY